MYNDVHMQNLSKKNWAVWGFRAVSEEEKCMLEQAGTVWIEDA